MAVTLYWLQCGGCGGDTWSLFNSQSPDVAQMFDTLNIELLWHPSISGKSLGEWHHLNERLISGEQQLDILCIEGTVIRGPGGTGMYDAVSDKTGHEYPKKDLVAALAKKANHILAIGTCACFGGIGASGEIEGSGLQFLKWDKGGFLGKEFKTLRGMPVINLPGCPCHCDIITGTLSLIAQNMPIELDKLNTPTEWYNIMVHQGCTRNEYHEYRVEEKRFGEKGCMFFYLGCHGPLVMGPCNKLLWNRRSSKTRAGVPCFGCTRPDFPQTYSFFETRNIEGIPTELPAGISRPHYMAYKGIAAAAAPRRLKQRQTGI